MCLVLFPSIWVSCNIGLLIVFVERRSSHSFMSVCPCFFFSVYWFPILCFHHALPCFGHPICSWSVIDRMWVSLTLLIPFSVLTCHSLCARQEVNAPCFLSFFQCPDLSLSLRSAEHECPFFFSVFWNLPPFVLNSGWVSRTLPVSFCALTCPLFTWQTVSALCFLGFF
jgi:hypothetical protein